MNNIINELKFQALYYTKNVLGYFSDILNAVLGRTRRQAKFLEGLVDSSISAVARLSAENAKLQKKLDTISQNSIKAEALNVIAKAKPSKKKASPKQGQ